MNGWTKYFADGSKYVATDYAIKAKAASWRNSRNTDMTGAELNHGPLKLKLEGLGEYWQSDTYESIYPGPGSRLIKRRIEKRIEATDRFYRWCSSPTCLTLCFNMPLEGGRYQPVPKKWLDQWIILEVDVITDKLTYYLRGNKI